MAAQNSKTNPSAPKLDESNSRRYRPRQADLKHAVLRWRPARYQLSWGNQEFDGPHMVIADGSSEYGADLQAFFTTHVPVPDKENHYRKVAVVRARRVNEATDLVTLQDGHVEATATVPAGGYIIQNPGGEQYYNTPEEFEKKYEPAD